MRKPVLILWVAIADYKIALIERIAKYYKPDMLQFHDDYSTNTGLFMPIDKWQRIIKPSSAARHRRIKGPGMIYQHHSCGKIHDLIPELVDMGIDAPQSGTDSEPLKSSLAVRDHLTVRRFSATRQFWITPPPAEQIKDSIKRTLNIYGTGRQMDRTLWFPGPVSRA